MATAECEAVVTEASGTRDEGEEEYPLQVEYCGLCTMPPEVKEYMNPYTYTCLHTGL